MSRPDVSLQIRNLEREIGLALFERLGKQIRLTEAGEILKDRANVILFQLRETEQVLAELKDMLRGTLMIGASTTVGMYILSPMITAFGRRYPGINTRLKMPNTGTIEQMMLGREVDIGFTVGIPIREVKAECLWRMRLCSPFLQNIRWRVSRK